MSGLVKNIEVYIRIDVAHMMKMYAKLLRNVPRLIRIFYLACIGKLIVCTRIGDCEKIIESICLVAYYEKTFSAVREAKNFLRRLFNDDKNTGVDYANDDELDDSTNDSILSDKDNMSESLELSDWARKIYDSVQSCRKGSDSDEFAEKNAHFCPILANRILKDMKYITMWSCISQPLFGYGRIPASSASVESEFAQMKNNFRAIGRMRPDVAVEHHLQYLQGGMEIVDGKDSQVCMVCDKIILDKETFNCIWCDKKLHKKCGTIIEVEGKRKEIICTRCDGIEGVSSEKLLSQHFVENWRGEGQPHPPKKRALYIGLNTRIQDKLTTETSKGLPILKNGQTGQLAPIKIGDSLYSLSNTCAFDSLSNYTQLGHRLRKLQKFTRATRL